jgi:hypothetical protein
VDEAQMRDWEFSEKRNYSGIRKKAYLFQKTAEVNGFTFLISV